MKSRNATNATARTLLVFALLSAGCRKDGGSVDVMGRDPMQPDAGASMDAGGSDASDMPDAAMPNPDSGSKTDSGSRDASVKPVDDDADVDPQDPLRDCHMAAADNALAISAPISDEGGFSLTIGLTGFGVAYRSQSGCGRIGALPVAALGAFNEPSSLLGPDCNNIQDVALLRITDGWQLAWVDNGAGSAELRTLGLSDGMNAAAGSVIAQVTHNMLREYRPVLGDIAGTPYAVWIAADVNSGKRQIDAKNLSDQSDVVNLLGADSGHKPVALAFSAMGAQGASLAFIDDQQTRGVWLQALSKSLAPVGSPMLVSDAVSAGSSMDIAARDEQGGAIIYSVDIGSGSHEVRFRRLDPVGNLTGPETKIVGGALQGRDASIARLGGGFVVAYRQLPAGAITKSEVRIAFITKEGDIQRDNAGRMISYPVADAGETGGRVTVRFSTDGELLVGFVDSDDTGTKLKLVRKRLDCAL